MSKGGPVALRALLVGVLVAALTSVGACGPSRRTRSAFEVLLAALPRSDAALRYEDRAAARRAGVELPPPPAGLERADNILTDGTWTAVGGSFGPSDALGGLDINEYRVNDGAGRIARDGFLLVGPAGQTAAALRWLDDVELSALGNPALRDLARAAGEPGALSARPATGCRATLVASARRFGTEREQALGAWVLVYATGEEAAADIDRVKAAAVTAAPPGDLLQVDLRPRYIVVLFTGSGESQVPASVC